MSQLVPCPACSRHVRLPSATCPFCDVALNSGALDAHYAPRRSGMQAGIKRAVIFAVGAGMAAACGGETEDPPAPDPSVQPVYGAPIEPSTVTSGATSDDTTSEPLAQPEYGAPIPDDSSVQAIYGAPVVPSSTDEPPLGQPEYGAPVPPTDTSTDATSADAGAGDGGADASVATEPPIDEEGGPTIQPLYGAPFAN